MPDHVSDQQLGDAVLESVQHDSFPQSEHVASAQLSPATLPKLLDIVGKAREEKKSRIRQISRDASSDVDGWIDQARKLQSDIQRSQETAQEIVKQAEAGKEKTAQVQDAASKVSFLHEEISYNQSLVNVVEQLKDITELLESAQNAAIHSHIIHALDRLEDARGAFKRLGPFENARVAGLLKTRSGELKLAIAEAVAEAWNGLVIVDNPQKSITLKNEVVTGTTIHIDTVVDALTKLGTFDKFITRLSRDLDNLIIAPRLTINAEQLVSALNIERDKVQIDGHVGDMSVKATLEDLQAIAEYISTRLPPSITVPLSEKLVPTIATRLINNWLIPAVPLATSDVPGFQETLSLVLGIVEFFDELGWSGQKRLSDWVDKSADIWLARQKEVAIARVQRLFPKRVQEKKTVERVETQTVTKGDALHTEKQPVPEQTEQEDDWGADWGEEEPTNKEEPKSSAAPLEEEEEDMSAWGMEEEEPLEEEKKPEPSAPPAEEEEEAEGWGDWDDDNNEETKPAPAQPAPKPTLDQKPNGSTSAPPTTAADEEITLRESYTVTAIPDSIIEIILQVISNVSTLNTPPLATAAIAPSSSGLYAIPSLLLAMYRATALTHYSRSMAANMLIYNDCTRLSDRLRNLAPLQPSTTSSLPPPLRPATRLKPLVDVDVKAIEAFGKRAYGREMESQRTIIRDLLDAAQGFASCTRAPFAAECDNAVAMTIDRITEVKAQWSPVLSPSVLLQSLGSLASTALAKFIADVEDMADIAEDESRKLSGYVQSLSSLSTLFQSQDEPGGEVRDMAHLYIPNWLKFQYLGEILDSTLADIKYFWTDGELKLEMDAEEVVDLVKALFAESEHRRRAVLEIRRTG